MLVSSTIPAAPLGTLCALAALVLAQRLTPVAARAPRGPEPGVPLWGRLLGVPFAFAAACLVAPLPVLVLPELASGTTGPGFKPSILLFLPLLALFTGAFSGPFALPALLVLAVRDTRSVGLHVALGALVTLPAMAFFAASVPGELSSGLAGAMVLGGGMGGLAASAVRDRVEAVARRVLATRRGWLGARAAAPAISPVPTAGETL